MHAEIISVELTSIRVATSPTVINSVTLIVLLSASWMASSSSDFWRCCDRLSLLYFAPFDLVDLPCNFSKVSLICFWTSSSLGSILFTWGWRGLFGPFLLVLKDVGFVLAWLWVILFLFFFLASWTFFSFLFTSSRLIVSPVLFGPDNFWYLVLMFESIPLSVDLSVEDSSDLDFFSVFDISPCSFFTSGIFFEIRSLFSCFSEILDSSFSFVLGFIFDPLFKLWRSIFPIDFGFSISTFEDFKVSFFNWSSTLSFSNLSWINLSFSFSFLFSSVISADSSFLDLSVSNSSKSNWYTSLEIFVVGLASIWISFFDKWSTTLSKEIFNSLKTLFNLILDFSAIFWIILKFN